MSAYGPEMYPKHRRWGAFDHSFAKPVDFDSLLPVLGEEPSERPKDVRSEQRRVRPGR